MQLRTDLFGRGPLLVAFAATAFCCPEGALAQGAASNDDEVIDEIAVTGRFISSSQQLLNERMQDAFSTDLLGEDTISRLGDSTVASALRRVPGLTLVQDKYVYIRGLGERYSSTTLNGAQIPSPDLTRNVIPLNVFPTSIVESLRVQKSYSPTISANFGGGSVDIRTKDIPDEFILQFEVGLGLNSENPSTISSYAGGGDDRWGTDDGTRALSRTIIDGLAAYSGDPSVDNIRFTMARTDPSIPQSQLPFMAQTVNREFALALNRDIALTSEDVAPDYKLRASVGNNFLIGTDWEAGFSVGASYETDQRWRRTNTAAFGLPEEQNGVREESTESVNIAGTANLGLKFLEDHEISTTTLFLRNTDNETEVFDFFNENRLRSSGRGFREYRLEFEERNMTTNQVRGQHRIGIATRERFPALAGLVQWIPEDAQIDWYYSISDARTDIPNRVSLRSDTTNDTSTGAVLTEAVPLDSFAADYRFTDLNDEVEDYGWRGMLPFEFGDNYVELSGGWNHAQKARSYAQSQFSLGYLRVRDLTPAEIEAGVLPVLERGPGEVFSDAEIMRSIPDPDPTNPVPGSRVYENNLLFDRQGANTNSYLAATMTDGAWGKVDWTWRDSWRLAAGARWEDYRQVAVSWDPYSYSIANPQIDPAVEEVTSSVFNEDNWYPAVAITYMGSLWADTFQLRLGYSETAVRPDLREITDSSYIDPITGDLVRGNPGVVPSEVQNLDLRAEWFFENSDNLTVTLFNKDIDNPIEFFEIPASDTTIAREILNADSATVRGVEFEFLKELGFLGDAASMFFLQGNLTLQESELTPGSGGGDVSCEARNDAGEVVANNCQLSGASDYVANLMIGFDSPDAKHTASLIYNVFGERLFAFGRFGPDAFEQPFQSLDATYFWYPTNRLTVKLKAQNILGSSIEIEREGVVVFQEDPGTNFAVSASWRF
ncbi:MAG: TonB-dependent receptor plug domain-containing protein [Woeseiaceae bacterium]|nr:TonB-dependent receptor plug domain-containing protein [Woeseiaceae bacterium]